MVWPGRRILDNAFFGLWWLDTAFFFSNRFRREVAASFRGTPHATERRTTIPIAPRPRCHNPRRRGKTPSSTTLAVIGSSFNDVTILLVICQLNRLLLAIPTTHFPKQRFDDCDRLFRFRRRQMSQHREVLPGALQGVRLVLRRQRCDIG